MRRDSWSKSLRELERYPEAEAMLLEAHRLKSKVEGSQFVGPATVADGLAELYRRWGRDQLSSEWAARGTNASATIVPE